MVVEPAGSLAKGVCGIQKATTDLQDVAQVWPQVPRTSLNLPGTKTPPPLWTCGKQGECFLSSSAAVFLPWLTFPCVLDSSFSWLASETDCLRAIHQFLLLPSDLPLPEDFPLGATPVTICISVSEWIFWKFPLPALAGDGRTQVVLTRVAWQKVQLPNNCGGVHFESCLVLVLGDALWMRESFRHPLK